MRDLAADRERFLATGEVAAGVRPAVLESWRRSLSWGVSPGELRVQQPAPEGLESARSRAPALLAAAQPGLELVRETLAGQPFIAAVADAEGVILLLHAAAELDPDALASTNLVEGASWHERSIGSNGVGTALAAGEPVILIGPEHFQEAYTGWTCIGVPIRDPAGRVAGALDLSVPNGHVHVHTWGWTLAMAQAIEARLAGARTLQQTAVGVMQEVADLDDPFHAIRGVLDLLAQQLEPAPTYADFLERARTEVERAAARLATSLRDLRDREERLRLVVENSPDITFIQDGELRYTWGSSRAGPFTADEYLGRTDYELFDDPQDARMLTEIKRRVLREGQSTSVELTVRLGGRLRRLQATFEPAREPDGAVVGLFGYVRDVTSEWRTRAALRDSHARLRAVLDMLPAGVWITDPSGRILETNAAAAALWGGRAPLSQRPEEYSDDYVAWWPDGRRVVWQEWALARAVREGAAAEGEEMIIEGFDGVRRTVLDFAAPIVQEPGRVDGAVGLTIDISAHKRTEQQMRRIAESGMVGLIFWELGGRITYANDYFLRMLGYGAADIEAGRLDWRRLTPPEWSGVDESAIAELRARGATTPFEKEFLRSDGTRVPVLLSAATFSQGDRAGVTIVLDITERRRAEAELQRLFAEAQEAVRQREEVVGIVSHDLRNPLSTIAMASALLLDPGVPAERKTMQATVIRRAVEQLMRLIQDLLDMSRLGASRFSMDVRREEPAALLRAAVQLSANAAEAKQVALSLNVPAGLPLVRGDRQRIVQVLGNLLANAIEFTPGGGRIVVGAQAAPGAVVFSVSDTGPGIPEEEQPRVFDRFWQGSRHSRAGTGLGLAICKAIVEAHGGSIRVESEAGRGATFRFTIPVT
jgi:PAS domain S-box-containing protein